MPNDEADPDAVARNMATVARAYTRWHQEGAGAVLMLPRHAGWLLLNGLQVTLHMEQIPESIRAVLKGIAVDLCDQICDDDPELAAVAALGFNPANQFITGRRVSEGGQ